MVRCSAVRISFELHKYPPGTANTKVSERVADSHLVLINVFLSSNSGR